MTRLGTLLALGLAILIPATAGAQQPQSEATLALDLDEKDEFLKAHNDARKEVGLEPLKWSNDLSGFALDWLTVTYEGYREDALAGRLPVIKPRPKVGAGKDIEYGQSVACWVGADVKTKTVQAVLNWQAEKKAFDKLNAAKPYVVGDEAGKKDETGQPIMVGNYTQMVWKNTTHVGAAGWFLKYTDKDGKTRKAAVIVVNYYPAGNVFGQKPY